MYETKIFEDKVRQMFVFHYAPTGIDLDERDCCGDDGQRS
jgi:hypothetical protein